MLVSLVTPSSGPTESAVDIRISGTGFKTGATVMLGGVPALNVVVVHNGLITATAPPHAEGAVDVVVANPGGESTARVGGYTYVLVAVTSVEPGGGAPGAVVQIRGTGFLAGASVTMDGVPASVRSVAPTFITAVVPDHAFGPVEVAVTNPGGQTGRLSDGFTYEPPPSVTVSPLSVTAGGQVTVSWSNQHPVSSFDWIGLFKVGDSNENYLKYEYTGAAKTGSVTFTVPTAPGQYEFRYLLDDGFQDVARSSPITVTASGSAR
jgi:hypothetical protein